MQTQTNSVYVPVETPDNKFWAFLLALLVHAGVIAFLIYTNHVENLDGEAMETTMVTPDELAAMQGQVKANQAAAASGQSANMADPTFATSPQTTKLNTELAQKQAKWQQQQAKIAADLDRQAKQEMQDFANQIKEQKIEEVQRLDEFKEAEATPDKFEERRDNAPKGQITMSNSAASPNSKTTDTRFHDFGTEGKSTAPAGQPSGTASNNATGKGSNASARANYRKMVERIVESNWTPPATIPAGTKVYAQFSISPSGQTGSVRVNSGNAALDETLRQAIQSSSLPPPPTNTDADYSTNNMGFTVKPR